VFSFFLFVVYTTPKVLNLCT